MGVANICCRFFHNVNFYYIVWEYKSFAAFNLRLQWSKYNQSTFKGMQLFIADIHKKFHNMISWLLLLLQEEKGGAKNKATQWIDTYWCKVLNSYSVNPRT